MSHTHKPGMYGTNHYNDLAKLIASMPDQRVATHMAHALGLHFSEGNARFDLARWYAACWPSSNAKRRDWLTSAANEQR